MQGHDGNLQLFDGLALRPQRPADEPFLRRLIHHSKAEIRLADKPKDEIHGILDQQVAAQRAQYPDMHAQLMQFIIVKTGVDVGRLEVGFGPNEWRIVALDFIPEMENKGYGTSVLKSLQAAARNGVVPLTCAVRHDRPALRQVMTGLGFQVDQTGDTHSLLVYIPRAEGAPPPARPAW